MSTFWNEKETKTEVAMVFVTTDETDVLAGALTSVADAEVERELEIIVVDNASSDRVAQRIEKEWPDVKVLRQEVRQGFSANLARGFDETEAPYLMICDADLLFRQGSVERLADFLDVHPRAGMANPKLLTPDGGMRSSARRWYSFLTLAALKGPWRKRLGGTDIVRRNRYAEWDFSQPRLVDWVPFAGAMVRRKALNEIGAPDTRFRLYFEDVDLSLRMQEAGWEVWNVPQAEVVHLENRASLKPLSRQWKWHLESLVRFWWKHRGLRPRPPRVDYLADSTESQPVPDNP
jgi:N-acetylglucosaminyl-diphospho-decaprenol L-rhamnosyltransferase